MQCIVCGNDKSFSQFHTIKKEDDVYLKKEIKYYRCEDCRFEFVYPQRKEELAELYRKEYRDEVSLKNRVIYILPYSKRHRYAFRLLKHLKKGKMLDIGSAEGKFAYLMKFRGWDVTCVEPTEHYAQFARKMFGLHVIPKRLEEVPITDKYDLVTLSTVLEHVFDPISILKLCRSFLNENGKIYIRVPNVLSRHYASTHLFLFTEDTLRTILAKCGLVMTKYEVHNNEMYVLAEKTKP